MKKFREISEQHREEGRHKIVQPKSVAIVSPRPQSDSANVKLKEAVKDKFDIGEYDQEGDMAKSDLRSILANAKRVHDMLEDSDNLPEWVQSKITKAEDYMSTVANYMEAEMNEEVELDESIDDKHFSSQSKKMQDAINLHLRKGKSYKEAVLAARKHVKEDFEQIDELNKSTLVSYIKKASQDKADRANTTGFRAGVKQPAYNTSDETSKEVGRGKGIARAAEKLAREEVELEEENKPTNPELWSRAKALAKSKFDVYPSAYANGWAAKWYKSKGGGWRSVNEENYEVTVMHTTKDGEKGEHTHMVTNADDARHAKNIALQKHDKMMKSKGVEVRGMGTTTTKMVEQKDDLPFTPDKPQKKSVIPGKYGAGYSTAKALAKQAMQKQLQKVQKKKIEEQDMPMTDAQKSISRKAKIVKDIVKKNNESDDKFQDSPELKTHITKA